MVFVSIGRMHYTNLIKRQHHPNLDLSFRYVRGAKFSIHLGHHQQQIPLRVHYVDYLPIYDRSVGRVLLPFVLKSHNTGFWWTKFKKKSDSFRRFSIVDFQQTRFTRQTRRDCVCIIHFSIWLNRFFSLSNERGFTGKNKSFTNIAQLIWPF